jgi:type I restriction enzyme S subunit
MSANYKKLGEIVELIDERNRDGKVQNLIGVSIDKCFIKSVANTIGTDLTKYQVIRKNDFACSLMQVSRDGKIPIACLKDYDEAIMSPAYYIFRIKNTNEVLPDYLAMWFMRTEFDREASYIAVGGVRGSMPWEDFCDMKLPVPDLKEQEEIVNTYNAITKRIQLKQKINENLEKTEQCLFEKSCNNENTEITLGEIAKFIDGDRGSNYPTLSDFYDDEYCLFLNASNVTEKGFNFDKCQFITEEKDKSLRKGHLSYNDIVLTSRGTVGNVALYTEMIQYKNVRINSGMLIIRPNENKISVFVLYALLRSIFMKKEIERFRSGSAQPQLPVRDLEKMIFRIPNKENCSMLNQQFKIIYESITTNFNEIAKLQELKQLVISRISGIQGEG